MSDERQRWDLFRAAHEARVETVKSLLAAGANVNARAAHPHSWTSAAAEPTPLNCALTAFQYNANLVEVIRTLLAAGATVDETHFADFAAESLGDDVSARIQELLESHAKR
jgi:hypothetical protein